MLCFVLFDGGKYRVDNRVVEFVDDGVDVRRSLECDGYCYYRNNYEVHLSVIGGDLCGIGSISDEI